MAVYLLLTFDDENEAKELVTGMVKQGRRDRIYGMYKRPTLFCGGNCSIPGRNRSTSSGFTRHEAYGWWVCAACLKPTRRWATNEDGRWGSVIGNNLLPWKDT